jgi:uncharacterized protein
MRILIDISHPAHLNFFKYSAISLKNRGHNVIISVLERGRLKEIAVKEYNGFTVIKSGIYRNNKWSILIQANIFRFFKQIYNVYKYKIDYGLSVGSFTMGAALKIKRKPNIQFDDDPERKANVLLEILTATKVFFPPIVDHAHNIYTYNALKEWSYLSPKYFNPNKDVLAQFNLEPKEYIFIREVSTKSLNYKGQKSSVIASFAQQLSQYKVLLSLENKDYFKMYPEDWIILKEPVEDIHSLIYYSKCTISSGDSMARESAMLGVPGIYCGIRMMKANEILIRKGMLFKVDPQDVPMMVQNIFSGTLKYEEQTYFRESLLNEWDDVSEFIINIFKT